MGSLTNPAEFPEGWVRIEGFHAVKHALRFGAKVSAIHCSDVEGITKLVKQLAPDIAPSLLSKLEISDEPVRSDSGHRIRTGLLAFAEAPSWSLQDINPSSSCPLVVLDDPRDAGNIGACIRVAAAVGAAGVVVLDGRSPFESGAIRGAAGLQYAVPVVRLVGQQVADTSRFDFIGLDADGEDFDLAVEVAHPAFVFGSERSGIRPLTKESCTRTWALPMSPGVSSLNLAASVAAATYLWRYSTAIRS